MKYNLEGKRFASAANSDNGEVGAETVFHYHQDGRLVWADYDGGVIVKGHLIGTVQADDKLQMTYHHVNVRGDLMVGHCLSTPEQLPDGRLKFYERWQWLTGDRSSGSSEIIEMRQAT